MSNISVGGQAVIEGVMMQSKDKRAIAVRKSNGKIVLKKNNIKSWINAFFKRVIYIVRNHDRRNKKFELFIRIFY